MESIGGWIFFSVAILSGASLFAQYQYYEFKNQERKECQTEVKASDLQKLQKEFSEYKSKVDALVVRSGFKP